MGSWRDGAEGPVLRLERLRYRSTQYLSCLIYNPEASSRMQTVFFPPSSSDAPASQQCAPASTAHQPFAPHKFKQKERCESGARMLSGFSERHMISKYWVCQAFALFGFKSDKLFRTSKYHVGVCYESVSRNPADLKAGLQCPVSHPTLRNARISL